MTFVTKVDDIPMTSVAEFRQAARQVFVHHLPGSVSLGIYLTWASLGGAIALLAFGLAGLAVTPQSWWIVLAGAVFLALVVRRIRNVFRRAAATRAQVLGLSAEIDARAARGEIPMTPPGWPGGVPAPPGA
ncbi:hypothetical protein AA0Y32_09125 [Georgenia phoenicis]|uniref:hypothetical protein n=1 Tax=unclassified Georgenia TaxID=2626815 RepID=UPI0039AFDABF